LLGFIVKDHTRLFPCEQDQEWGKLSRAGSSGTGFHQWNCPSGLKPGNFMIAKEGNARIMDFGSDPKALISWSIYFFVMDKLLYGKCLAMRRIYGSSTIPVTWPGSGTLALQVVQ